MKLSSLLSEAGRNLASGTSRTGVLALLLSVMIGVPMIADIAVTTTLVRSSNEFRESGASIVTLIAPNAINGAACDALVDVPNVHAAGALDNTDEQLTLAVLPQSPVDIYQVTDGFAGVLSAQRSKPGGILLTDEILRSVDPGADQVLSSAGEVTVGGVFDYPADGRRPGFGWAALVPVPAVGTFDECWAEIWPSFPQARSVLLTSLSASPPVATKVTTAQLNGQHGAAFDGFELYQNRITRFAPAIACLLGFAVAMLAVRLRRLEMAARLHDGASRRSLRALVLIETVGWLVPGCVLALGASAVALYAVSTAAMPVFAVQLGTAACAFVGGILGCLAGVATVHERHLFTLFKDR